MHILSMYGLPGRHGADEREESPHRGKVEGGAGDAAQGVGEAERGQHRRGVPGVGHRRGDDPRARECRPLA